MRVEYNINKVHDTSYPLAQYGLLDVHSPVAPGLTKRDRETSAAMNWLGGADHRRRPHGKIPAMQKRRAQIAGSESFYATRQSCCESRRVEGAAERPNHGKAEEAGAADERGRRR
jgi:hypothetical protein